MYTTNICFYDINYFYCFRNEKIEKDKENLKKLLKVFNINYNDNIKKCMILKMQ